MSIRTNGRGGATLGSLALLVTCLIAGGFAGGYLSGETNARADVAQVQPVAANVVMHTETVPVTVTETPAGAPDAVVGDCLTVNLQPSGCADGAWRVVGVEQTQDGCALVGSYEIAHSESGSLLCLSPEHVVAQTVPTTVMVTETPKPMTKVKTVRTTATVTKHDTATVTVTVQAPKCHADAQTIALARELYKTHGYDGTMNAALGEEDSAMVNIILTWREQGLPFNAGQVSDMKCAGWDDVSADGGWDR